MWRLPGSLSVHRRHCSQPRLALPAWWRSHPHSPLRSWCGVRYCTRGRADEPARGPFLAASTHRGCVLPRLHRWHSVGHWCGHYRSTGGYSPASARSVRHWCCQPAWRDCQGDDVSRCLARASHRASSSTGHLDIWSPWCRLPELHPRRSSSLSSLPLPTSGCTPSPHPLHVATYLRHLHEHTGTHVPLLSKRRYSLSGALSHHPHLHCSESQVSCLWWVSPRRRDGSRRCCGASVAAGIVYGWLCGSGDAAIVEVV